MAKNKRTKAVDISSRVRASVKQRDKWCIFCGRNGTDCAHVIPRSSGGLGIVQNLVLACRQCHVNMDFTSSRQVMLQHARKHLDKHYPNYPDEKRVFKKWSPIDD